MRGEELDGKESGKKRNGRGSEWTKGEVVKAEREN